MKKETKMLSRRELLLGSLCGAGMLGLRSLATGLPATFLRDRIAHAEDVKTPQYLILATSGQGDPMNANAPGSYANGTQNNPLPELAAVNVTLGAASVRGAACWNTLPEALRARLSFFHHRTYTNAHPEHRKVMTLQGAAKSPGGNGQEMLPSVFASELAATLGTIQTEPVPMGGELVTYGGRALDNVDPVGLKSLFDQPDDLLATLTDLRDQEIDAIYGELKARGTKVQRSFLDRYALGREQVRKLGEDLGALLTRVPVDPQNRNSPTDEVLAAVALMKLKVAPVATIHLPFGGDNHNDSDLTGERDQHVAAMATLTTLWNELVAQGLEDQVTFAALNVFGRTLKRNGGGGRNHNQNHHVMMMFGKNIRGGVVGGITPVGGDFGATAIDSRTGKSSPSGDIDPLSSLESAGKTLWSALDLPGERRDVRISGGKIVTGALVG